MLKIKSFIIQNNNHVWTAPGAEIRSDLKKNIHFLLTNLIISYIFYNICWGLLATLKYCFVIMSNFRCLIKHCCLFLSFCHHKNIKINPRGILCHHSCYRFCVNTHSSGTVKEKKTFFNYFLLFSRINLK